MLPRCPPQPPSPAYRVEYEGGTRPGVEQRLGAFHVAPFTRVVQRSAARL